MHPGVPRLQAPITHCIGAHVVLCTVWFNHNFCGGKLGLWLSWDNCDYLEKDLAQNVGFQVPTVCPKRTSFLFYWQYSKWILRLLCVHYHLFFPRVNCSFYFKIGACRHGDRCSRLHNKPTFSQVRSFFCVSVLVLSLAKNCYSRPLTG